jgi:hypothetical protein
MKDEMRRPVSAALPSILSPSAFTLYPWIPMINVPPVPFVSRRSRVPKPTVSPPPPVALTLVSATYEIGTSVELTFDRAIDIAGIDVAAFFVDDGALADFKYQGYDPPELLGPASVRVLLTGVEDGGDPGTHLTVGADSGIVAVDDGGTWAGVTELALPYP